MESGNENIPIKNLLLKIKLSKLYNKDENNKQNVLKSPSDKPGGRGETHNVKKTQPPKKTQPQTNKNKQTNEQNTKTRSHSTKTKTTDKQQNKNQTKVHYIYL